jgi:hypothetical protein
MMTKSLALLLTLAVLLGAAAPGMANDSGFGLGVIIGEPTGLSLKAWTAATTAVQGGVAWSLSGDNDLHLQADFLRHDFGLITVSKGRLPLYYGIGGRLKFRENRDDKIGIRVPVGLDYLFTDARFDIFVEIVPILDLAPDTDFDLSAALGGRFYF